MCECVWCNLSEEERKWLLIDNDSWSVYLADEQDYIGRCILVLKRHCGSLAELTDNEFIEASEILVHAPDKSSGRRLQEIEIIYNHIGVFDHSKITLWKGFAV